MSGAIEWTLSNGATECVKKTDFKEDRFYSPHERGGFSMFEQADNLSTKVVGEILPIGGVGNFSLNELRKVLAGKTYPVS